jgi:outer membrane protein OmpA-like peptidoglycan-associated protein
MGILIFIIIALLCIFFKTGKIEQDLLNRSKAALGKEKVAPDSLWFNGRDAGLVVEADKAEQAKKIVAGLYGVRIVKVETKKNVQDAAPLQVKPKAEEADSGKAVLQDELKSILSTKQIRFRSNSVALTPESKLVLEEIIKILKPRSNITIEVSGHTDSTGDESHNLVLSKQRAQAVVDYLRKNGVTNIRFITAGYGSSKQVAENTTRSGRQKNRRIEFIIKGE